MDSLENITSFPEVESASYSAAVALLTDLQYVENLSELVHLLEEWSIGDNYLFDEGVSLLIEKFPREFFCGVGVSYDKIKNLSINDYKYFLRELIKEYKCFSSHLGMYRFFISGNGGGGKSVSLLREFSVLNRQRFESPKNAILVPSIDQISCSWEDSFERILASPYSQASSILDFLAEVALSKTAARKRVFRCRRPCTDTSVPPKTREQIQTFAIRTGNPPPVSISEKLLQSSLSLKEGDLSTEDGGRIGHSKFCRTMVGRGVQDRKMHSFGCRSNQSRPNGARPFRCSQSFAGFTLSTFTSPVEGSRRTWSLSYSRQGRDMDQFHLAASGLYGCSTRVNFRRW